MYNKQRCVQQIYEIAKDKGIKIGDLEKKAGVSTGYLSRVGKEGSTSTMSVDLLVSIAKQLDTSVAFLLMDTSEMSEGEKYISKFIDKLILETKSNSLDWEKQTLAEMRAYDESMRRFPLPFFAKKEKNSQVLGDNVVVEYVTRFYDEGSTNVNGACFWTEFGWEGAIVYITSITHQEKESTKDPFDPIISTTDAFEVYIDHGEKLIPLCNTDFLNEEVSKQVKTLYTLIADTQAKIGVNSEVRGLIDNFITSGLPFN